MTSTENFERIDAQYERLIKQYEVRLKKHALQLTLNHEKAGDLYQDTVIKLYLNLHTLKNHGQFFSWAKRTMSNLHIDTVRYNQRRPQTVSFDELNAHMGFEVDFEDKKVDVENEVMLDMVKDLNSRQLRMMISSLNPVFSSTISLCTYGNANSLDLKNSLDDGYSYEQVSAIEKIEVPTIRSRVSRARKMLKHMLENDNVVFDHSVVE